MKYLMLVRFDPENDIPEQDGVPDIEDWLAEMDGRGVRYAGDRIRPSRDATTVRVRSGRVLVTDGPYAETKDLIAGFDLLDCANIDEAVEIASKHPMAWAGSIELYPFWHYTLADLGLPSCRTGSLRSTRRGGAGSLPR